MTAEVVVMNKSAIALAADSKVTVGGYRNAKTYDTVNKLFTLSKYHPVGVMVYGNAEFMDYPWETIIKLYRRQKGRQDEDTISDWAENFLEFLRAFGSIEEKHKERNLKQVCRSWFSLILDEADDTAFAEDVQIGSDKYKSILREILQSKIPQVLEKGPWLQDEKAKAFIEQYGKIVDAVTEENFKGFEDDELFKSADRLISAAILGKVPSPRSSGIVIAGFGREEFFPTVLSLETDGYVGGDIKVYREGYVDISRELSGCLRAFAQGEMVQRFMSGLDPDLYSVLMTAFHDTLTENCLTILNKYGSAKNKTEAVRDAVKKAANASISKLVDDIGQYTTRNFSNPIVNMVSLLPKDELANLAESLVALTSLKRRVSSDAETVGGAIDVALISKGDGFVWIKRKYYFPEDLNPQFNRTYLQEQIDTGEEDEGNKSSGSSKRAPRARQQRPSAKASGDRSRSTDKS